MVTGTWLGPQAQNEALVDIVHFKSEKVRPGKQLGEPGQSRKMEKFFLVCKERGRRYRIVNRP